MVTTEEKIKHYKERIKDIFHLRNSTISKEHKEENRLSLKFAIRRIHEYKGRV
jgi:hypothetical protein